MLNTFCHVEIPTSDLAKAKSFYESLFGWQVMPMMENYWYITLAGEAKGQSGGLLKVDDVKDSDAQAYVEVEDVAATLKKAESLGARIIDEKRALPNDMGFIGMFQTEDGFKLGLFSQR